MHGKSTAAIENISSSYYSKVIAEFITQLNLKNIVIVGNSIGGATAKS